MSMNIILRPELQRFVEEKVRDGQYASASDVVSDALEALQELEELRQEIASGIDQLDSGDEAEWDVEAIKAEARRSLGQRPE